jgi:hypothetical protein
MHNIAPVPQASRTRHAASTRSRSKSSTRRIVLSEPDGELLTKYLEGRQVSPALARFLKNLISVRKWMRKINIPSGRDDLAAALIFTTNLKPGGLEIICELHVHFAGHVIVEEWEVLGEHEQASALPGEMLRALEIDKVRARGDRVTVELTMPRPARGSQTIVRCFDFAGDIPCGGPVPNPFPLCPGGPARN